MRRTRVQFEEISSFEPSGAEIIGIEDTHKIKIITKEKADEVSIEKHDVIENDLSANDADKLKTAKKLDTSDGISDEKLEKKAKKAEEVLSGKKQKPKHQKEEEDAEKLKLASEEVDSKSQASVDDQPSKSDLSDVDRSKAFGVSTFTEEPVTPSSLDKPSFGDDNKLDEAQSARLLDKSHVEDSDKPKDSETVKPRRSRALAKEDDSEKPKTADTESASKTKGIAAEDDSDKPKTADSESASKAKGVAVKDDGEKPSEAEVSKVPKLRGLAVEDENNDDKADVSVTLKSPKSKAVATKDDGEKEQETESFKVDKSKGIAIEDEGEKEIDALMERIQRQRSVLDEILDNSNTMNGDILEGSDCWLQQMRLDIYNF